MFTLIQQMVERNLVKNVMAGNQEGKVI